MEGQTHVVAQRRETVARPPVSLPSPLPRSRDPGKSESGEAFSALWAASGAGKWDRGAPRRRLDPTFSLFPTLLQPTRPPEFFVYCPSSSVRSDSWTSSTRSEHRMLTACRRFRPLPRHLAAGLERPPRGLKKPVVFEAKSVFSLR